MREENREAVALLRIRRGCTYRERRAFPRQQGVSGHDGGIGDVAVLGDLQGQALGSLGLVHAEYDVVDHGCGAVRHQGKIQGGVVGNAVPVDASVLPKVVFGGQLQGQLQPGPVLQACRRVAEGELLRTVIPAAAALAEKGRVPAVSLRLSQHLAGIGVPDGEEAARRVADQAETGPGDRAVSGDGVAFGIVSVVQRQADRVAAQIIWIIGIQVVGDGKGFHTAGICAKGSRHVGFPVFHPVGKLQPGALIVHGGLGPAAVITQHGDGMPRADGAVVAGRLGGKNVTLDVSAAVVVFRDVLKGDGDADLHRTVRGDGHAYAVGGRLARIPIRRPAHVRIQQNDRLIQIGSVHRIPVLIRQEDRAVILIQRVDVIQEDVLGEKVRAEGVSVLLVGEVIQGEGKRISPAPAGIVPQLGLDLAVGPGGGGVGAHEHVGIGVHGRSHVHQAGALPQDGIIQAAPLIQQGAGGGHEQGVNEGALGQHGLFRQVVFPDILGHQRSDAGDLRRSHGGAAHGFIALAAGDGAVHGIDIAAGSRDLRLQAEVSRDAPAGEGAHGIEVAAVPLPGGIVRRGDGVGPAFVVHGGNGQRIGVGAGGAAGVVPHVVGIQIIIQGEPGPVIAVAGGYAHHRIAFRQAVHEGLVAPTGGKAGSCGTQG